MSYHNPFSWLFFIMAIPPKMTQRLDNYLETHDHVTGTLTFIRTVIVTVPMRGAELMLACLAAMTGFWMGHPSHHMYRSEYISYRILTGYMPGPAWTILFLLAAAPSLFLHKDKPAWINARIVGNAALLSVWTLAALLFFLDKSPYLATAWSPIFVFYQAWVLLAMWLKVSREQTRLK